MRAAHAVWPMWCRSASRDRRNGYRLAAIGRPLRRLENCHGVGVERGADEPIDRQGARDVARVRSLQFDPDSLPVSLAVVGGWPSRSGPNRGSRETPTWR
jgi:hypothetical protein